MDTERFIEDCIAAHQETEGQAAVREVMARAVAAPRAVIATLGEPVVAGLAVLHRSPTLTIFSTTWTPQMNLMPHNHLMWANIAVYTGREDNLYWRETEQGLRAFGGHSLFERDTVMLPDDVVHSVTNPLLRFTGAIHAYGGDFFGTTRSQWDPETLEEQVSDGDRISALFDRENLRHAKLSRL
ncbi:MAG: hypothetical protein R3217_10245 [Gammaproteobacteria bacterium]|nr:hypothetical protein [Gammaproteobacteria bacterium]